jgi:hypothetical protein
MHNLIEDLSKAQLSVEDILRSHLEGSPTLMAVTRHHQSLAALSHTMESFFGLRSLQAGEALFERDAPGSAVYIVLSGSIASILDDNAPGSGSTANGPGGYVLHWCSAFAPVVSAAGANARCPVQLSVPVADQRDQHVFLP